MPDPIESRLRDLARAIRVDQATDLPERVVARLAAEPARPRTRSSVAAAWVRARGRWLAGLVAGLLGLGVVLSPVGADVREWFGFHGVVVEERAPREGEPSVPAAGGDVPLRDAERRAGFPLLVPAALGPPDEVVVADGRPVVSMSWGEGGGTIRLDQFDGEPDPLFWKTALDAELVRAGGVEALWFPTPHEVVVLGRDGIAREHPPRLAAATLIWSSDGVTRRLEGDLGLDRALDIALRRS